MRVEPEVDPREPGGQGQANLGSLNRLRPSVLLLAVAGFMLSHVVLNITL